MMMKKVSPIAAMCRTVHSAENAQSKSLRASVKRRVKAFEDFDFEFKGEFENHRFDFEFQASTISFCGAIKADSLRDPIRVIAQSNKDESSVKDSLVELLTNCDKVLADLLGKTNFIPDFLLSIKYAVNTNEQQRDYSVVQKLVPYIKHHVMLLFKVCENGADPDFLKNPETMIPVVIQGAYEKWAEIVSQQDSDTDCLGDAFPASELFNSVKSIFLAGVTIDNLADLNRYRGDKQLRTLYLLKSTTCAIGAVTMAESILWREVDSDIPALVESVLCVIESKISDIKQSREQNSDDADAQLTDLLGSVLFDGNERLVLMRELDYPMKSQVEAAKEEIVPALSKELSTLLGVEAHVGWQTSLSGWEESARQSDPDYIEHMKVPPVEALRVIKKLKEVLTSDNIITKFFDFDIKNIVVEGYGDCEDGVLKTATLIMRQPFNEGMVYADEVRIPITIKRAGV